MFSLNFANMAVSSADTEQLIKAIEYKKETDRVLLPRANSAVVATFTQYSTEEDLRKFIYG